MGSIVVVVVGIKNDTPIAVERHFSVYVPHPLIPLVFQELFGMLVQYCRS